MPCPAPEEGNMAMTEMGSLTVCLSDSICGQQILNHTQILHSISRKTFSCLISLKCMSNVLIFSRLMISIELQVIGSSIRNN